MNKSLSTDIRIFNTIRATLSLDWQNRIPAMSKTNFNEYNTMITRNDLQLYWNEWLDALLNKIGLTVVRSRLLRNKLARFKSGTMEYGDIIEELGVEIMDPQTYQGPELYDEGELCLPNPFCKEKPDVRSHFHKRNREEFYQRTIFRETLKKSFRTPGGLSTFVEALIQTLYSASAADEYLWTKELFSKYVIDPVIPLAPDQIITLTNNIADDTSSKQFILALKVALEDLSFNSNNFNPERLTTYNESGEMVLLVRKGIIPVITVESLSAAFNESRLAINVDIVIVDDFGTNTVNHIPAGPGAGPNDVLDADQSVAAMLVDRDWFMIYDNLRELHTIFNPKGLYWNYFYHIWQTYAVSYMKNALIFVEPEPVTVRTAPSRILAKDC